ncbi:MAG: hypothetical protein VYA84_13790 [Planctomycetota bacterium]|nr:hypothetical protein [Planctomycetota bacterium]
MRKNWFSMFVIVGFAVCPMIGCGGSGENAVIEAPVDEVDDASAMEGMSDEEYDREMNQQMNQQG